MKHLDSVHFSNQDTARGMWLFSLSWGIRLVGLSLSLSLSLDLPLVKLTINIPLSFSPSEFFTVSRIFAILVVILCVFLGIPILRFGEQYGSNSWPADEAFLPIRWLTYRWRRQKGNMGGEVCVIACFMCCIMNCLSY